MAASMVAARKEKAALKQSSAQIISGVRKMRKNLDKAKVAVQAVEVRETVVRHRVVDLNGIVKAKSGTVPAAVVAAQAHL